MDPDVGTHLVLGRRPDVRRLMPLEFDAAPRRAALCGERLRCSRCWRSGVRGCHASAYRSAATRSGYWRTSASCALLWGRVVGDGATCSVLCPGVQPVLAASAMAARRQHARFSTRPRPHPSRHRGSAGSPAHGSSRAVLSGASVPGYPRCCQAPVGKPTAIEPGAAAAARVTSAVRSRPRMRRAQPSAIVELLECHLEVCRPVTAGGGPPASRPATSAPCAIAPFGRPDWRARVAADALEKGAR